MKDAKNLVLQIVGYNSDSERVSRTNEIYSFVELMNCHCSVIEDEYRDSFVVYLAEDDFDFCHQINAFSAFCHFRKFAMKLESYPFP